MDPRPLGSDEHENEAYESSREHPIDAGDADADDWHDEVEDSDEEDSDEDPDYVGSDDEGDDEFHDAEDGDLELQVIIESGPMHDHGDGDDDEVEEDARNSADGEDEDEGSAQASLLSLFRSGHVRLTQRQLLALVRGDTSLEAVVASFADGGSRRRRNGAPRFPKVPSDKGRELMESGVFGAFDIRDPDDRTRDPDDRTRDPDGRERDPDRKRLARRVLERELGLGAPADRKRAQGLMAQGLVPATPAEMVVQFEDPVCCGQFSDDGNFFYACVKDYRVRMYDTSNPYKWRYYKTVSYPSGQWTLTDADLSPDNKWLAFTSLDSKVCFAPTDPNDTGDPYTLDLGAGHSFAIYSVRFSEDARTIVAGTGGGWNGVNEKSSIVVYDIERRAVVHRVPGHNDDVNAVCFADKSAPHILFSGSDDCTVKVWDTRSLGDGRAAGAFVGHVEGLTYIDSKGDGRYILSNGKDQTMKLWDLRMAMSSADFERRDVTRVTRERLYTYDYRMDVYQTSEWFEHPEDNSLVTFRGHQVQRTLIRCHFSPPGSTDARYVYSGSYDGCVYIWDLDARLRAKIDVKAATRPSLVNRTSRRQRRFYGWTAGWTTLVRDVGWHPNAPLLVASAWNGPDTSFGTASLHSFNDNDTDEGDPAMGIAYNDKLGTNLTESYY